MSESHDSRPLILLGAGGHARVLAEALRLTGAEVLGCTAIERPALLPAGFTFLGSDEDVFGRAPQAVRLVNGLGSTGLPQRRQYRQQLFERFKAAGYDFAQVIHPTAFLARDVVLGEGVQIMAGAVLQPGCRLGDNVIVNTRAGIDHDCEIGAHSHVAPGATLSGGVSLGAASHIGTGATVIQGITIAAGAVVGAGAAVVCDLEAGVTAAGVPARPLRGGGTEGAS